MDFKVQMVVFLSLIMFSYLLCFGSFTLSLTFPKDTGAWVVFELDI